MFLKTQHRAQLHSFRRLLRAPKSTLQGDVSRRSNTGVGGSASCWAHALVAGLGSAGGAVVVAYVTEGAAVRAGGAPVALLAKPSSFSATISLMPWVSFRRFTRSKSKSSLLSGGTSWCTMCQSNCFPGFSANNRCDNSPLWRGMVEEGSSPRKKTEMSARYTDISGCVIKLERCGPLSGSGAVWTAIWIVWDGWGDWDG